MTDAIDILRAVARAPMRTMRYQDARSLGANSWRVLDDLVDQGALKRIVRGVYTAPPNGQDARTWSPSLEAAALAVAASRHGSRQAILMGIGAARFWGAIPRAIGSTVVAIPVAGRRPLRVGSGTMYFAHRDLGGIDASVERTELGSGLVASREQTLFDLLMRPAQGGNPEASAEAVRNLRSQIDLDEFAEVVGGSGRANDAVRRILQAKGGAT